MLLDPKISWSYATLTMFRCFRNGSTVLLLRPRNKMVSYTLYLHTKFALGYPEVHEKSSWSHTRISLEERLVLLRAQGHKKEDQLWKPKERGTDTPIQLLQAVFFYVGKVFCIRGVEQWDLKVSQFQWHYNLVYIENGLKNSGANLKSRTKWVQCIQMRIVVIHLRRIFFA